MPLKNMNDWNRMPDALKEQVFKYLDQLAAVANLSEENRIAYDKAVVQLSGKPDSGRRHS